MAGASLLLACGQPKTQQEQPQELLGGDKDEHGCIATAGYIWSELLQNCIRLFESGTRLETADGKSAAFLVFSPDSSQVEVYFSNESPTELLDRRTLPKGGFAWNVESDDTKNVTQTNGLWTISQRGVELYREVVEEETDQESD